MTKKLLSAVLAALLVFAMVPVFTVGAAKTEYYVKAGADGKGTQNDPFGTLEEAIWALDGNDGTVYVIGSYSIDNFDAGMWDGEITFTGADETAAFTLKDSFQAAFRGHTVIKDIRLDVGDWTHINPYSKMTFNTTFTDYDGFIHLGSYMNINFEESEFVMEDGYISSVFMGGAYCTNLAAGVLGNDTLIVNGGEIGRIMISSDHFLDTHTGITVGNNLNIVINDGYVGAISNLEEWQPEIMGALNIVFNNGITPPDEFIYPTDAAASGTYIIRSFEGGKIMPTDTPGVFSVQADEGKVAVVNGVTTYNGFVTFEEGQTFVTWEDGVQQKTEIKLTIDSKEIVKNGVASELDVPAQIINSRTMVPLRAIFEALGATVEWDDATRTVTSQKGNTSVKLTIGEHVIYVNGVATSLDVPAQIVDSRTLVPARAIAEAYGCEVGWDDATRTVTILEK